MSHYDMKLNDLYIDICFSCSCPYLQLISTVSNSIYVERQAHTVELHFSCLTLFNFHQRQYRIIPGQCGQQRFSAKVFISSIWFMFYILLIVHTNIYKINKRKPGIEESYCILWFYRKLCMKIPLKSKIFHL